MMSEWVKAIKTDFLIWFSHVAATIQLPLVSVTHLWLQEGSSVTFKCPQQWKVKHSFKPSGVTETNCPLTINNFKPGDRGIYIFYGSSNSPADIAHLLTIEGGELFNPLTSRVISRRSWVPAFLTWHANNLQVSRFP